MIITVIRVTITTALKEKKKNSKHQHFSQGKSQIKIIQSPFLINNDDNEIYVDTNYKHYNATVRCSNKGIQLKNLDAKSKKPPILERRTFLESFNKELLATIADKESIRDHPLPMLPKPPPQPPKSPPPLPIITPPPHQPPRAPDFFEQKQIMKRLKMVIHLNI